MRYRKISQTLLIIFFLNLIVAFAKIILGIYYQLNSLLADGFHAITDCSSNIIGLIAIKFAAKPADEKHPYGHQKFETIASMIIGFILLIITYQIIYRAIKWFINPLTPEVDFFSLILIAITFIINLFISIYEYRRGKKLQSEVLIADSIHTRSDLLISFGVILITILIILNVPPIIDPILSLIIALFIFYSCMQIIKSATSILVDSKTIDHRNIEAIVYRANKDIIDVHKIRSRGTNNHIYIDLHLILPREKTIQDAHELSHKLEKIISQELQKEVDLFIHIEPDTLNSID